MTTLQVNFALPLSFFPLSLPWSVQQIKSDSPPDVHSRYSLPLVVPRYHRRASPSMFSPAQRQLQNPRCGLPKAGLPLAPRKTRNGVRPIHRTMAALKHRHVRASGPSATPAPGLRTPMPRAAPMVGQGTPSSREVISLVCPGTCLRRPPVDSFRLPPYSQYLRPFSRPCRPTLDRRASELSKRSSGVRRVGPRHRRRQECSPVRGSSAPPPLPRPAFPKHQMRQQQHPSCPVQPPAQP